MEKTLRQRGRLDPAGSASRARLPCLRGLRVNQFKFNPAPRDDPRHPPNPRASALSLSCCRAVVQSFRPERTEA
jgi:hypothetical protein